MSDQVSIGFVLEALTGMLGMSIETVSRQLYRPDFEYYPAEIRDEESDGTLELRFSNGEIWHFLPTTESSSVDMRSGEAPQWGESYFTKDITTNHFWTHRTKQLISKIVIYRSFEESFSEPSNTAIVFELRNGSSFAVEYISDDEHVDSLRITPTFKPESNMVCVSVTLS